MTKAPTKAELAKLVASLQRENKKLRKQLAFEAEKLEATQAVSAAFCKIASNKPRQTMGDAGECTTPKHVTPLPANEYGPFPWEPKQ